MDAGLIPFVSAILGSLIGGVISYLLQKQRLTQELLQIREQHKTEFMAESSALRLLNHQGYTDRTFQALKDALGGFEDDELRKILVRAGAMRVKRSDGEERWCLIAREPERIERLRARAQ